MYYFKGYKCKESTRMVQHCRFMLLFYCWKTMVILNVYSEECKRLSLGILSAHSVVRTFLGHCYFEILTFILAHYMNFSAPLAKYV